MTLIHQWIYNTLILFFFIFQLTGCSKDNNIIDEEIPPKMSSERIMDAWLQKHVSRYADSQGPIFRAFYDSILGENSPHNLSDDFPSDDDKTLKAFVNNLADSLASRSTLKDENINTIVNKLGSSFLVHFRVLLNEHGKERLKNDKESLILEFSELWINMFQQAINEGKVLYDHRK